MPSRATAARQEEASEQRRLRPDRDSWCTPKWIAEAVGPWDLDPCSNERSHVRAAERFDLSAGLDGLAHASAQSAFCRVFVNPPYSNVRPWVRAYAHVRFCFLLKFDPSTRWFCELYAVTALVAIPRRRRISFEPPPGVKASSNQFPHALFYAHAEDATPAILRLCIAWRTR